MAGQRQRMTPDYRAVLAVVHPGPRGLMPRNAHDAAGAAAVERTDQGDMERHQLQGGALEDAQGATEAEQPAERKSVVSGKSESGRLDLSGPLSLTKKKTTQTQ